MAQFILSDENCVGHCRAIVRAMKRIGVYKISPIELRTFEDEKLIEGLDDEAV